MLVEQIKKLIELGNEAVKLSETSEVKEPSFKISWDKNGEIEAEFYSYCLELEDGRGWHFIKASNEIELEEKLDHLIFVAEREITALSRHESVGCN